MAPLLSIKQVRPHTYNVRITTEDFVGLLSLVTGLFAAHEFAILRGAVQTHDSQAIDIFVVRSKSKPDWRRLEEELTESIEAVRRGQSESVYAQLDQRLVDVLRTPDLKTERIYPVRLETFQNESPKQTVIEIRAQDTPAFLYALSHALSLLGINIVRMEARTDHHHICDRLWVTGLDGKKITSEQKLRALQWSILLIKQMTRLLPLVPDPGTALREIVLLGKDLFDRKDFDAILLKLKESRTLETMSRVMGTSPFLWEEFIRSHHTAMIPILGNQKHIQNRKQKSQLALELKRQLGRARSLDRMIEALNIFKDEEMFRIDLRHLVGKTSYVGEFAEEFSDLVEVVVGAAHDLAWKKTLMKLPHPMVSKKRKSCGSLVALGKFGGRELGYASDLELMFVYEDTPANQSDQSAKNLLFYNEWVRQFSLLIHARSEGVFEIDMRLRPYGQEGPLAVSMGLFKDYYSGKGPAWNYERQALIKLRPVAGDRKLGCQIERARDAFVYSSKPFDIEEAVRLRSRQRTELASKGCFNAKYSEGGLLDAEYLVQSLQIIHGQTRPAVRQTNTLKAVQALRESGVLKPRGAESIVESYHFLRDLINALRIVRGHAKDLNIPSENSSEFAILARRMKYEGKDLQVRNDFKRDLSRVVQNAGADYAAVMEKLKTGSSINVSEQMEKFVLSNLIEEKDEMKVHHRLKVSGFHDVETAYVRMKFLAETAPNAEVYRRTMDGLASHWKNMADPDLGLASLDRFLGSAADKGSVWKFLANPERDLTPLVTLWGSSEYLSETLVRIPGLWRELKNSASYSFEGIRDSIRRDLSKRRDLNKLRTLRHALTLKIVLAETLLHEPLEEVYAVLSLLGDTIIRQVLDRRFKKNDAFIIGLGKLGGQELNYSSDVDILIGIAKTKVSYDIDHAVRGLIRDLSEGDLNEFLYRVDLRLRPYGEAGSLYLTPKQFTDYYHHESDLWEHQAMLKMRFVAGSKRLGERVIQKVRPLVYKSGWTPAQLKSTQDIKRRYEKEVDSKGETETNIKMGRGGIRDIEFTVQSIQLTRGHAHPKLKTAHTLKAIEAIRTLKILNEKDCACLKDGYLFLRSIENRLQLFENKQTFLLPSESRGLMRLARSLGFYHESPLRSGELFSQKLLKIRDACRRICENTYYTGGGAMPKS